jgi:hypothetical protein
VDDAETANDTHRGGGCVLRDESEIIILARVFEEKRKKAMCFPNIANASESKLC